MKANDIADIFHANWIWIDDGDYGSHWAPQPVVSAKKRAPVWLTKPRQSARLRNPFKRKAPMLQRDKPTPVTMYGFLVGIELQPGSLPLEKVADALADACSWMEGTGKTEVEILGPLDIYPDTQEPT